MFQWCDDEFKLTVNKQLIGPPEVGPGWRIRSHIVWSSPEICEIREQRVGSGVHGTIDGEMHSRPDRLTVVRGSGFEGGRPCPGHPWDYVPFVIDRALDGVVLSLDDDAVAWQRRWTVGYCLCRTNTWLYNLWRVYFITCAWFVLFCFACKTKPDRN